MIKKNTNQNNILNKELLKTIDYEYLFNNKPIQRTKIKPTLENSSSKLKFLENKIKNIKNCELKKKSSKLVFGDGNILSPLMIIGDAPSQKDNETGKPFMGDGGKLLKKMLNAINIDRDKIYLTNVINYFIPTERKLEQSEINRYSVFLKEHILIINPIIIVIMGSVAMNSLLGINKKISEERGKWKEIIIGKINYKAITTFHPDYLLKKPDQKKFSWEDLKIIQKEIKLKNIKL